MNSSFIIYLLESSISLLLFIAVYRLLIARLTYFNWMRYYLIACAGLSLILPLIHIPVRWGSPVNISDLLSYSRLIPGVMQNNGSDSGLVAASQTASVTGAKSIVLMLLMLTYLSGVIIKSILLFLNLKGIHRLIKKNPKQREGNYWIVDIDNSIPAFSFLNYIFLNRNFKKLSPSELLKVRNHELIHARQYHSLDILLIEIVSIFFWFNPVMSYIKMTIQEIHEYIADEEIAGSGQHKDEYAGLLLSLATESRSFNISAGFALHQIRNRIIMIKRHRSRPLQRLAFAAIVPVTILSLLSFSLLDGSGENVSQEKVAPVTALNQEKFGDITWKGNNVYSNDRLNEVFGLKKGDMYSPDYMKQRLKITDLYLDNGYVFFKADFNETRHEGVVDLAIEIYEGKPARIGNVTIKADITLPEEIRIKNNIHPGDQFSKAEIMKLVRMIGDTGKFDREKINPKPIVNQEKSTDENPVIDLLIELKGI
jgi:beta-lactamase regulating signal transducer with metallopeptidase domain